MPVRTKRGSNDVKQRSIRWCCWGGKHTYVFHGAVFLRWGAVRCNPHRIEPHRTIFQAQHRSVGLSKKKFKPHHTKLNNNAPTRTVRLSQLMQTPRKPWGHKIQVVSYGSGTMRCGFWPVVTGPLSTVRLKTVPHSTFENQETHRTVRLSNSKFRTAPHRRIIQIQTVPRGAALHPHYRCMQYTASYSYR